MLFAGENRFADILAAPAITGVAEVGNVLTCSTGTWSRYGTMTYQWYRDGVAIGSATSNQYTLVEADGSADITCIVTNTSGGAAVSSTSNTYAISDPAPVPAVANQTIEFGKLTKIGAGGFQLVSTGGPITGSTTNTLTGTGASDFAISATGVITPTVTPLQNSYTLTATLYNDAGSDTATLTINCSGTDANGYNLANCYSVANLDQLEVVLESTLTLGTNHVLCRAGTYISGTSETDIYNTADVRPAAYTGTVTAPSDLAVAGGMTAGDRGIDPTTGNYINVAPHDGAEGNVNIVCLRLLGTTSTKGGIRLTGLKFGWTPTVANIPASTFMVRSTINDLCIDNCTFQGAADDPTIYLTSQNIYLGCFALDAARSNIFIQDNTVRDVRNGFHFNERVTGLTIVGNDIQRSWADRIYFNALGSDILIAWNSITNGREFTNGQHPDYVQIGGPGATDHLDGCRIIGNRFWFGNTTSGINDGQGIFFANVGIVVGFDTQTANFTVGNTVTSTSGGAGTIASQVDSGTTGTLTIFPVTNANFVVNDTITASGGGSARIASVTDLKVKNTVIRGNTILHSLTNGIYVEDPENIIIRNNTVLLDKDATDAYEAVPGGIAPGTTTASSIIMAGYATSAGTISDNITNNVAGNAGNVSGTTESNNSEIAATLANYQTLFDNPAFMEDVTDLATQYSVKAGSAADTASPKRGASPYVNYSTRTTSFPA